MKKAGPDDLDRAVGRAIDAVDQTLHEQRPILQLEELGTITFVGNGIARIRGLRHARSEELLILPDNKLAIAFNLDPDEVAAIMLDKNDNIKAGGEVRKTGRVMDVPVGEELLGRVVDAMGRPLDEGQPIHGKERRPIEREAPAIMDRAAVNIPLQTGILAVDAMIPIGRGQRELILGDRQIGKTAIALDTMINQIDKGILCVYCAIGQQRSALSRVISDLRDNGAMDHCIIVVATGEDPPGHNFIAPYAATSMAEYFMEKGRDVLIVYDDLTRHARSYRELSLLLRRPPGREAFPGDIFYIHSRLLERSTHLQTGGSLTALPIVETEAQDISAYIPTNLISITDGQIYLSPELFAEGILPAIDIGRSVSRVGGKSQLPAYHEVAGDLRLSYSQFEELEAFARFGARSDEVTRKTLEHGRRIRETLKQPQYEPMPAAEQVAVLLAATSGILDSVPLEEIAESKRAIQKAFSERLPELGRRILAAERLNPGDREAILEVCKDVLKK
ncbi:MAG: alternate F1F0 ATPase, F1 subunit alpha [Methanothrix sp.]|jgi:F-type H+-transporting ATPase subunit alpha|uniref:alternate F1F0 ATPase, F1 subunit alpha n=1 Tax=Methanothrix sp. TaxID=90426 RepID=UPI001BD1F813|nr:alternate F1F0 ATPase, F1 subunit alpha [Methanothrix sp.]